MVTGRVSKTGGRDAKRPAAFPAASAGPVSLRYTDGDSSRTSVRRLARVPDEDAAVVRGAGEDVIVDRADGHFCH